MCACMNMCVFISMFIDKHPRPNPFISYGTGTYTKCKHVTYMNGAGSFIERKKWMNESTNKWTAQWTDWMGGWVIIYMSYVMCLMFVYVFFLHMLIITILKLYWYRVTNWKATAVTEAKRKKQPQLHNGFLPDKSIRIPWMDDIRFVMLALSFILLQSIYLCISLCELPKLLEKVMVNSQFNNWIWLYLYVCKYACIWPCVLWCKQLKVYLVSSW